MEYGDGYKIHHLTFSGRTDRATIHTPYDPLPGSLVADLLQAKRTTEMIAENRRAAIAAGLVPESIKWPLS